MNRFRNWLRRWLLGTSAAPTSPLTAAARMTMSVRPEAMGRFAAQASAASDVYTLPTPAPGVLPDDTMAMDYDPGITSAYSWAGNGAFSEGIGFMGFPYLSELSQRPEYRMISETFAREMTRKWIKITAKGDKSKADKVQAIEEALDRFNVQQLFRELIEHDGFFGRAHLYIDVGKPRSDDLPLILTPQTVKKGSLKAFRVVEPIWTYPNAYNSNDPRRADFYKPQSWFVMGDLVHKDRLVTLVGRELPDLLKPSYGFAGLSRSQMSKPYVDNWLRTRQSVSDLLHSFSTNGIKTNMAAVLDGESADDLYRRAEMFNVTRDNKGLMLLDKDSEEFFNVSTPLTTVDALQAASQEQQASVAGIPLVILLGVTPSGLNASSDGEIRVFYDRVAAQQAQLLTAPLNTVLQLVQLNEFGEIDPAIGFTFNNLWETDEMDDATNRKAEAETDAIYTDAGILSAEEVRERLAQDEDSPYAGLDLSAPPPEPPADPALEPDLAEEDEDVQEA